MKNTSNLLIILFEKVELFLYHRAKAIIALTPTFKTDLINRKIPAEKIFVVRNGANLDFFKPQAKDNDLIANFKLANYFVAGYIGTLGMAHGLENILYAAKSLENSPIKILFVGAGAEKDKLQQLAKNLALNNVIFIPIQPKSEIKRRSEERR